MKPYICMYASGAEKRNTTEEKLILIIYSS